ncbi:MAG: beta-galactosidase [Ardenticatenales bacterium]|nr:beta-galactosidase [Ardenticatenales bacterium]
MPTFTYDNHRFVLNDQPFHILAGAMHYFRVLPEYWDDRLHKMRAMGLNTLETYVAWNLHEPQLGAFDFDAGLDLAAYIQKAAAHGLYAIVRPGPYICSEWEFGGLPAWLLREPDMRLRCMHRPYLDAVDRYFDALIPQLAPLQVTHGGPIIAMQIENEYGSYGNDKAYLRYLKDGLRTRGVQVPLFTSDGPTDEMLQGGTLPHILKTVNLGSRAETAFAKLREYQPGGPLMCAEFWNGWFDHWGEEHHTRSPEDAAETLAEILAAGASVSLYMFHGGTNWGFMNGANSYPGPYQATITSYDYDAPLNEAGDPTPKYLAFRDVIGQYDPLPDLPVPAPSPKMALGSVALSESVNLIDALDHLATPVQRPAPTSMESLGQNYGFVLYRTHISGPRPETELTIRGLRDRAQVFINDSFIGVLERECPEKSLSFAVLPDGAKLEILVENMGRVNYGPELLDRKGITEGVLLGQQYLFGWTIFPLPLDDLSGLNFAHSLTKDGPTFFRGIVNVKQACDTFLALPGWTKGVCWLNGFNLGRYWQRGPQKTFYVPAPLFQEGENEIVLFELHGTERHVVEFHDHPDLANLWR